MKVRFDEWLKQNFDPVPHIQTARRWISQGKVYPQPIKVGRAYYVEKNAVYQDGVTGSRLAQRIA